jgi:hypothetical protein
VGELVYDKLFIYSVGGVTGWWEILILWWENLAPYRYLSMTIVQGYEWTTFSTKFKIDIKNFKI